MGWDRNRSLRLNHASFYKGLFSLNFGENVDENNKPDRLTWSKSKQVGEGLVHEKGEGAPEVVVDSP